MKDNLRRLFSITIASIFSYFVIFQLEDIYANDASKVIELIKQIVSVAGVLLGFILTALSILTAVMDKTLISSMVRTGHFKVFVRQAFMSCFLLFFLIIFGLIAIGLPNSWSQIYFSLIFVLISLTIVELYVTSKRFYNVTIVMSESIK